jgi:hypothetical protein
MSLVYLGTQSHNLEIYTSLMNTMYVRTREGPRIAMKEKGRT